MPRTAGRSEALRVENSIKVKHVQIVQSLIKTAARSNRSSRSTGALTNNCGPFQLFHRYASFQPFQSFKTFNHFVPFKSLYRRRAVLVVPSLCSVPIVSVVPVRRTSFKPFNRCATFKTLRILGFKRELPRFGNFRNVLRSNALASDLPRSRETFG